MNNTRVLGITHSVCETCRAIVPAKVVAEEGRVDFIKFCTRHGESRATVHGDVETYLRAQRFVKPAWMPKAFSGDAAQPCPSGCGFCSRHEQHLCMPIVEITTRCDLNCPICLNASGGAGPHCDMSVAEFQNVLDRLIEMEGQIDILNFSGGEPLLHPQLIEMADAALARKEIVRVSISTNGLELLRRPELTREIASRDIVVSLQLDGFDDRVYETLRGRKLLNEKRAILKLLAETDTTTSLTMTVAGGVNENQMRGMLDYFFAQEHVVSMMLQPIAFTGRAQKQRNAITRLGIYELIELLGKAEHPAVSKKDFLPLPCSHPLCFSLGFYLSIGAGETVSINSLTNAGALMDALANRVVFGLDAEESERLKSMIYEIWSGPAGLAPDGRRVLDALRGILRGLQSVSSCSCFDPRAAFTVAERKVKSIFIHAFQDAETFDISRARRCCQAYVQPSGHLAPACMRNVLSADE